MSNKIPEQPAIPYLQQALDQEWVLNVCRMRLAVQYQRCEIRRIKLRPGTNCIITYALAVSPNEPEQYITLLLTSAAQARKIFAETIATFGSQDQIQHWSEMNAVVWRFPFDRKLHTLPAIYRAINSSDLLTPELLAALGIGQDSSVRGNFQIERYIAERSCTIRGMLDGGTKTVTVFGKVYVVGEAVAAWRVQNELFASQSITMPKPLVLQSAQKLLWQSAVPGDALRFEQLSDHNIIEQCATALACLHQQKTSAPVITPQTILTRFQAACEIIQNVLPVFSPQLRALQTRLSQSIKLVRTDVRASLHGDLHRKNILIHNGVVGMIDFDNLCTGEPILDIASLIANIHQHEILSYEGERKYNLEIQALVGAYQKRVSWPVPQSLLHWYIAEALISERALRCVKKLQIDPLESLIALAVQYAERI